MYPEKISFLHFFSNPNSNAPVLLPTKRRQGEVKKSYNSRSIGGGPMPTNLLRAPRVLDPALSWSCHMDRSTETSVRW